MIGRQHMGEREEALTFVYRCTDVANHFRQCDFDVKKIIRHGWQPFEQMFFEERPSYASVNKRLNARDIARNGILCKETMLITK